MTTQLEQIKERLDGMKDHDPIVHEVLNSERNRAISDIQAILPSIIQEVVEDATTAERQRIEEIFKRDVPPHGLSLEDGVWLKRLLNKAFHYEK